MHPITSWAPLIVVLTIATIREGVDDYARYTADCAVNNRLVDVVHAGRRLRVPCSSITPGTLVVVPKDAVVPCDLLLATSGADHGDGRAYVETAALDGESDLKPRSAPGATSSSSPEELSCLHGTVDCPLPNSQLYAFDAVLNLEEAAVVGPAVFLTPAGASSMPDTHSASAARLAMQSPHDDESSRRCTMEAEQVQALTPPRRRGTFGSHSAATSLSGDSLLQAGTVMRDTEWVAGWAIYTGADTKASQCSSGVPTKVSDVEDRVNAMTWFAFRLQLCLVAVFALSGVAWNTPSWLHAQWYLRYPVSSSAWFDALVLCVRFLLLNSFMIPVSLKVLLDISKSMYARQVAADGSMCTLQGARAAVANSNCIEDCGIVSHVLTDKTGTLTDNVMHFEGAFIVGAGPHDDSAVQLLPGTLQSPADRAGMFWSTLVLCNAVHSEHVDVAKPASTHQPWQWHPAGLAKLVQNATSGSAPVGVAADEELLPLLGGADSPQRQEQPLHAAENLMGAAHLQRRAVSFHSPSPDEEALVHAAALRGLVLAHRDPGPGDSELLQVCRSSIVADAVHVHAAACTASHALVCKVARSLPAKVAWYAEGGDAQQVQVLHSIPFSSSRKRMSVIVRSGAGAETGAWMLCKGADDVMVPRLAAGQHGLHETQAFLYASAKRGLRTLIVAVKRLSSDELARFEGVWHSAHACVQGRQGALDAAATHVEHSLHLVGATAIQDALQPGVPAALQALRTAGIATWMLTGDKGETALQIARAAQLCRPFTPISSSDAAAWQTGARLPMLQFACASVDEAKAELGAFAAFADCAAVRMSGYAVAISGESAAVALSHKSTAEQLRHLLLAATQVVCSRASPENKAQLVALCKGSLANTRVLAIGDGGNDVPMIQAAHVGVGISGREGEAAARAADATVPQFASLLPLLLFHGRRAHRITTFMAQFALYKSILMCSQQILFNAFFAAQAGSSLFDSFSLTAFNTLFTTAPLAVLSLGSDVKQTTAVSYPALYRQSLENVWLTPATAGCWALAALLQGGLVWISCWHFVVPEDTVEVLSYSSFTAVLLTVFVSLWALSPIRSKALTCAIGGCCCLFVLSLGVRSVMHGNNRSVARAVLSQVWGACSFAPWLLLVQGGNVCVALALERGRRLLFGA